MDSSHANSGFLVLVAITGFAASSPPRLVKLDLEFQWGTMPIFRMVIGFLAYGPPDLLHLSMLILPLSLVILFVLVLFKLFLAMLSLRSGWL